MLTSSSEDDLSTEYSVYYGDNCLFVELKLVRSTSAFEYVQQPKIKKSLMALPHSSALRESARAMPFESAKTAWRMVMTVVDSQALGMFISQHDVSKVVKGY